MATNESDKTEASAVLATMLSIEKRLMERMEAIEARITVVEQSVQRVEAKQNASSRTEQSVSTVIRDASLTDSESEVGSAQGEDSVEKEVEDNQNLLHASKSLPPPVAGPSASLLPDDLSAFRPSSSRAVRAGARRAISLDYEEVKRSGRLELLSRTVQKPAEGQAAVLADSFAIPLRRTRADQSVEAVHSPATLSKTHSKLRSRFKPAPVGQHIQQRAPAKTKNSSNQQSHLARKRTRVESSDARPQKRVRLQPYVLLPPVGPRWVIEETHTAIQRWTDDVAGHTDDGSENESLDEGGALSNLTELSSSDEEEDERRAAEALLTTDEEDEAMQPDLAAQGDVDGSNRDHSARSVDPSRIESQDHKMRFTVKEDPEDGTPIASSSSARPTLRARRPHASSSAQQASQPEVKQQPVDYPPLPQPRRPRVRKASPSRNTIGPDAVRARLEGVPTFPVNLDEAIRRVRVDRSFMSSTFGGGAVALYPKISDRSRRQKGGHSYHFLFPNPKFNPDAPKQPGEPGLMCRMRDMIEWDGLIVKVLVKQASKAFLYMGDYESTRAQPLSHLEFQALPQASKTIWMKAMQSRPKFRNVRARATLRNQLEREPTAAELKHALESNDHPFPIEEEVILREFNEGREHIKTWRMVCVAYDEQFQRRLAREYPTFLGQNRTKTKKESDD